MIDQVQPMRDRRGRTYTPAIGPKLRPLLWVILISFAVLGANGLYLASVTALTWYLGTTQQTFFYMLMVILHLLLGFLLIVPFVVFGFAHLATSWKRPNRGAVRYGLALLITALVILASGLVLVRIGGFEIRDPWVREVGYWLHVAAPLAAIALYVKHRLAGPMIRWHWARRFGVAVAGFVILMAVLHREDPRTFGIKGPKEGKQYFYPSEAITANGKFIPARDADDGRLLHEMPQGCLRRLVPLGTSQQLVQQQAVPVQRPRDPAGLAEARREYAGRAGGVPAATTWCRSSPERSTIPTTTTSATRPARPGSPAPSCHAITNVNNTRGNAAYTIEEPVHYPFAYSDNPVLQWINQYAGEGQARDAQEDVPQADHQGRQVLLDLPQGQSTLRAEPLSRLRPRPEPLRSVPALGRLGPRGQELLLSGSRQDDLHRVPHGAQALDRLRGQGLRRQGRPGDPRPLLHRGQHRTGRHPGESAGCGEACAVPGRQEGPDRYLRPPRRRYDRWHARWRRCVPRTPRSSRAASTSSRSSSGPSGSATCSARALLTPTRSGSSWRRGRMARSSATRGGSGRTAWSIPTRISSTSTCWIAFGNRIDRRNPQDIFVPLYNKQIPPGAGQVVHFALEVPEGASGPIELEAKVNYRKFDRTYMDYIFGKGKGPELPIVLMARDAVRVAVQGGQPASNDPSPIQPSLAALERLRDRPALEGPAKGGQKGELRQAEEVFRKVAELGPCRRLGQPGAGLPEGGAHPRGTRGPGEGRGVTRNRRRPGSSTGSPGRSTSATPCSTRPSRTSRSARDPGPRPEDRPEPRLRGHQRAGGALYARSKHPASVRIAPTRGST